MRCGIYTPNFGDYADPGELAALAAEAERAGWDGFFLYDHLAADAYGCAPDEDIVDPWIALAAIACATRRLVLGPLVTAAARRRPWKLAREIASLDRLSRGRLVFGAGLGGPDAFAPFGEDADPRVRAEKLDEALDVAFGLCSGEAYAFRGRHFRIEATRFLPACVQRPRVPVWIAGLWPHRRPFVRAARWDGAFPLGVERPLLDPDEIRALRDHIDAHRPTPAPYELVVAGATEEPGDAAGVTERARAGATWWLEWLEPSRGPLSELRARVRAGPPRVAVGG